ncbi:MAG: methylated-DNA--[protein]-cysteine S-methyltransferase, partial [Solirubrobacteraceae bacterium]
DRVRAVGAAVGRTPVPIIVPCHRVIGADGSLTGYGGGLQRKQSLLDLEAAVSGGAPPPGVWAGRQLSLIG